MILRFLKVFISILCVLINWGVVEAKGLLTVADIKPTVQKFFDYHISQKEMTTTLLERSLKIYIDDCDPLKIYLLEDEVKPYLNPSDSFLSEVLSGYYRGSYDHYFELEDTIRKAVVRARTIRSDLLCNYDEIFAAANDFDDRDIKEDYSVFASNEDHLIRRWRERMMVFIKSQSEALPATRISSADRSDIINLYLHQCNSHEKPYMTKGSEEHSWVVTSILRSLARSLDSHSDYFSPEEAYQMRAQLEKSLYGVGIVFQEGLKGATVVKVLHGTPADRDGRIQKGDVLVEIDGQDLSALSFDEVLSLMSGEDGDYIKLLLRRNSDLFDVKLKREAINFQEDSIDVDYTVCDEGLIGIISLHSFYDNPLGDSADDDVLKALNYLKAKGELKGLVLDLRDNYGGFLMQAVKVAGLFISNGVVVVSKYYDGGTKYYRDIDGLTYYDGPMVVLTSKASASAAEIVAEALQDYGRAIIVGDERTYGKGTVQYQNITDDTDEDGYFKVTVGRYYTVSGKSAQLKGVQADIIVPTKYYDVELGERYLEYPLSSDSIAPSYNDSLEDLSLAARVWFNEHYRSTLQKKSNIWTDMLPSLIKNSKIRLAHNKNYERFLKDYSSNSKTLYEGDDLLKKEAVEVVRDMINFSHTTNLSGKVLPKK